MCGTTMAYLMFSEILLLVVGYNISQSLKLTIEV
jgi:hypothetical protein